MNVDRLVSEIAKTHLDIDTLEERHSDDLDFHTVSVWQLRRALLEAFGAGQDSVKE